MKKFLCFLGILLFATNLVAQMDWYDPMEASSSVIQNRCWNNEIKNSYQRLPDRVSTKVRKPAWNLSKNSAGLGIYFYTNADKIEVKYRVTGPLAMPHMPATGKSGIDLYAIDSKNNWHIMTGNYSFSDTVTFIYTNIVANVNCERGFQFRMYLPLYNNVEYLKIGVPQGSYFSFVPELKSKPIVVYGTSIAQGGCASRPAMGWTNILSRKLDLPVVNLGFSNNGSLESELVDLISEIDAALIIYDCLPNMNGLSDNEIKKRIVYGISEIRNKSNVPILFTDHIGLRNEDMNTKSLNVANRLNYLAGCVLDSLKSVDGVKNIFHLQRDSISFPVDGAVDYIHPNDLGMQAYGDAYEKIVKKILNTN